MRLFSRVAAAISHAGTGVIFDLFTLGALIAASVQFQTDSGAFMSAVKEIAGTSGGNTGLNVVDKAAQARSTLKVLGALSSISKLLQVRAALGACELAPQQLPRQSSISSVQ